MEGKKMRRTPLLSLGFLAVFLVCGVAQRIR
jgi:hypothetical protein